MEYAATTRRLPGVVGGAACIHHFLGGDRTIPEVVLIHSTFLAPFAVELVFINVKDDASYNVAVSTVSVNQSCQ